MLLEHPKATNTVEEYTAIMNHLQEIAEKTGCVHCGSHKVLFINNGYENVSRGRARKRPDYISCEKCGKSSSMPRDLPKPFSDYVAYDWSRIVEAR